MSERRVTMWCIIDHTSHRNEGGILAGEGDIAVDLEGKGLDPRAVSDAIEQIESLVTSISGDESVQLTLTDLHGGSAHITMAIAGVSLSGLRDGIEELRHDPLLPGGWGRESLQAVVGLAKVSSRRGVESISVRIGDAVSVIDGVIQANAEKALAPSSQSFGSVRGKLYRYTNDTIRNRRSAGLRRTDTGEAVELRFAPDDAPVLRQYLEREVEIWGEVARDTAGQVAYLVVEGIESADGSGELTSAAEGRGLLGTDWLGGMDSAEWVRTMRG